MFNKIIAAIVGRAEDGQRKLALCTYVITVSAIVLIGCVLAICFVPEVNAGLLEKIAQGCLSAITASFGLLAGANVLGDHLGGALKSRGGNSQQ